MNHFVVFLLQDFRRSIFRSTFSNWWCFTNRVFFFFIIYSTKKERNVFYICINIFIQLFITNTAFDAIHYNSTRESSVHRYYSSVQENSRYMYFEVSKDSKAPLSPTLCVPALISHHPEIPTNQVYLQVSINSNTHFLQRYDTAD